MWRVISGSRDEVPGADIIVGDLSQGSGSSIQWRTGRSRWDSTGVSEKSALMPRPQMPGRQDTASPK